MCELWKYFLYVQKDTLGRSLRIHLRGFDLTVSEHFGNALNGHALRQCHLRCEGMPGRVENIFHLSNWKNVENKPVTCCELVDFLYSASMIGKQFDTEY